MKTAIVTPTHRGDHDRFALLCDSIDAYVTGHTNHYVLVEKKDISAFRRFNGPRRQVVDEREILPSWLTVIPDPLSLGRRRLWLSAKGPPLRGWHVQQLRKIAMTLRLDEDGVLHCDSDTVFVRPTDLTSLWSDSRIRFYRRPAALGDDMDEHLAWSRRAGALVGLPDEAQSRCDYIAQMVPWRTDTAREMSARIEQASGRSWAAAVAADRTFSEYMIYGRYVDEVENRPDRHWPGEESICHTLWSGKALRPEEVRGFIASLGASQTAVGIQSFIAVDADLIRMLVGLI